jgi:hypothetical protein
VFMHPNTETPLRTEKTFFCNGLESNRPLSCNTIAETALNMGIITDLAVLRSPDR